MGCWNHTCAVTNLPIFENDEVEVILLKSSGRLEHASFCWPTEYYSPLPLTFHGKYNDYGAVTECEGSALDIIVSSLRNTLFEMDEGENEYHDIPARRDEFDITKLFELDHESRLYIHNREKHPLYDSRDKCQIKHIVIRKNVYDRIVETTSYETWNNDGTKDVNVATLRLEYPMLLDDLNDIMNIDEDTIEYIRFMMNGEVGDTGVSKILCNRYDNGGSVKYPINILDELIAILRNKKPDIEKVIDNAIRFFMFRQFISAARKSWHVPSGVGSQDYGTKAQELCAQLTLDSAEEIKQRFDEEDW